MELISEEDLGRNEAFASVATLMCGGIMHQNGGSLHAINGAIESLECCCRVHLSSWVALITTHIVSSTYCS